VYERSLKSEQFLQYGLSTLHCKIKFFECIIHIAYKLPFKKWIVSQSEKQKLDDRKRKIQNDFKTEMGLLVDKVKTGYGTSNDGNTARRFFNNIELSSKITGVDIDLIKSFALILSIISSGYNVHVENFKNLLRNTFKLYIELYPWYYMPATVHKVLVHGAEIVAKSVLPIGMLSEDALEATHKVIRKARLEHTRKCRRKDTNRDLMVYLLIYSEPILSTVSIKKPTAKQCVKNIKNFIVLSPNVAVDEEIDYEETFEQNSDSESDTDFQ